MAELCTDNRFELIEKYKQKLMDATNIETSAEEMAVIDDILFRFWQMGWLDKLEQPEPHWIPCEEKLPEADGGTYLVTDYCEQINRRRVHVSYCYVNREGFWSDVPLGYKVIAWMPIEPCRGEEP